MADFGTLVFFNCDDTIYKKYPLKKEEKCTIGGRKTCTIPLFLDDKNLRSVHCLINLNKNRVATILNNSRQHPVQVNGEIINKHKCLRNGDEISILGNKVVYENKNISSVMVDKLERTLSRVDEKKAPPKRMRSFAASPKPRKSLTVARRKRLSSLSGSVTSFVTKRHPNNRLSTSLKEKRTRVHTPRKTKKASTSTGSFTTPQSNTSLVVVESPIEEEPPVRSRKSKVKNQSIQRLTENDDSVKVLDTPVSKTPKSTGKAKTPKIDLKKSKLLNEILGGKVCTSTPAKRKTAEIVEYTLDNNVCFTEDSIHNTSIANLSAVEEDSPSSDQNGASKSIHFTKPSTRRSTFSALEVTKPKSRSTRASRVSFVEIKEGPMSPTVERNSELQPEMSPANAVRRGRKRNRGSDGSLLPAKKFRYKSVSTLDEEEFNSSVLTSSVEVESSSDTKKDDYLESSPLKPSIPLEHGSMTEPRKRAKKITRSSLPSSTLFAESRELSPLKRTKIERSKEATPLKNSIPLENRAMTAPRMRTKMMMRNSLPSSTLFAPLKSIENEGVIGDSKNTPSKLSIPVEHRVMTEPRMRTKKSQNSLLSAESMELSPLKSDENPDFKDATPLNHWIPSGHRAMTAEIMRKNKIPRSSSILSAELSLKSTENEDSKDATSIPSERRASTAPRMPRKKILRSSLPSFMSAESTPLKNIENTKGARLGGRATTELRMLQSSFASSNSDDFAEDNYGDSTVESVDTSSFLYVPGSLKKSSKVVKRLLKTRKEPLNDLTSPKGLKKLFETPRKLVEPLNDLSSPKGVKRLMKTPKMLKEPLNDLSSPKGVKRLMKTPKMRKEPLNDLSSPKGVKKLMKTPKLQKDPLNDLSSPRGVKKLMKTPKLQKEPLNDLSSPRGVKKLMKTPKLQKEPLNDLSSPRGVKKLMKTPKLQKEPLDDLSSPRGVKNLMKTPKLQKEPLNDLSSPRGVKKLMKTPKLQKEPLNDLSSPRGVKKLMKTPKLQKEPLNDLSSPWGVKGLMKTPKVQKEPLNDLSSPRGVKKLLKTPRPQIEPLDDLSSPKGVKKLMKTPKPQREPCNDLSSPKGVKCLFKTPKLQKEPLNDLSSPKGVECLFKTPQLQKDVSSSGRRKLVNENEQDDVQTESGGNKVDVVEQSPEKVETPKKRGRRKVVLKEEQDDKKSETKRNKVDVEKSSEGRRTRRKLEIKDEQIGEKADVEQGLDKIETPKKRGRRKLAIKEEEAETEGNKVDVEQSAEKIETPKRRGRRKLEEKTETEGNKVDVEKIETPKRRGRRKLEEKTETEGNKVDVEKIETPRKRNRRNLINSEEQTERNKVVEQSSERKETPKKRGGRKLAMKEENTETEESKVDVEQGVEKIQSPKKRGRRKLAIKEVKKEIEINKVDVVEKIETPQERIKEERIDEETEKIEPPKKITKRIKFERNDENTEMPRRGRRKKADVEQATVTQEIDAAEEPENSPEKAETQRVTRGRKKAAVKVPEEEQNVGTPKRGRGRKKAETVVVDVNVQAKRRGKPVTSVDDVRQEEQNVGRKKAETTTVSDVDVSPLEVKRVDDVQTIDEVFEENVVTPKRGRGRKKAETVIDVLPVQAKRRGKNIKSIDDDIRQEDLEEEQKVETPKRGRGRKKAEPVNEVDVVPAPAKRKRKQIKSVEEMQQDALDADVMPAPTKIVKSVKKGKEVEEAPAEQVIRKSARTRK